MDKGDIHAQGRPEGIHRVDTAGITKTVLLDYWLDWQKQSGKII